MILLSVIAIAPFYTAGHTVFDGGWRNATAPVDHPLLRNNFTTSERAAEINEMLSQGRALVPEGSLIIGSDNRRFFSEYLFGSRNRLWPHSWSDNIFNDAEKVEALKNAIAAEEPECIVMSKYGTMNDSVYWADNAMRNAIVQSGKYKTEEHKWFIIFRKLSAR
ncbi:MAG: hypothetical protein K2I54_04585 [Muribaculaceae bacterium]|nr:hypothetical protein [Muribaculaceae bacterium]